MHSSICSKFQTLTTVKGRTIVRYLIFTPQCLQITSSHFSNWLSCSVIKKPPCSKTALWLCSWRRRMKEVANIYHHLGLYVQSRFMNKNLYLIWRTLNSQYFMWRVMCMQYLMQRRIINVVITFSLLSSVMSSPQSFSLSSVKEILYDFVEVIWK